jgi:hypothetical protein
MLLLRLAAGALGLAELLFPRRTAEFWVSRALVDGSDVEWQPWVYTAARIEGAVLLWWALRSGGTEHEPDPDDASATG